MTVAEHPPPSIAERQAAERRQRHIWSVVLAVMVLHGWYFAFPFIPLTTVRSLLPVLALFPPLFSVAYAALLFMGIRRWRERRQEHTTFVPIPPRTEETQ